jgi:hypothetical protein
MSWADAWTASLSRVSPALFADLQRDHPIAWKRFEAQIDERKQLAARHLAPFLRDDVHAGVAILMLDRLVMQAADPGFIEALGITRREAVRSALAIWGGGALKQRVVPRAKDLR